MTTIAAVRQGLADAITTGLPDWRADPYVGEQVNPPQIKVVIGPFDPRYVLSEAKKNVLFRCHCYATRSGGAQSEAILDALAEPSGSGSFIAAVQTSSNWSATVDYAQVVNVSEIQVSTFGTSDAIEYFVRTFDVEVVW